MTSCQKLGTITACGPSTGRRAVLRSGIYHWRCGLRGDLVALGSGSVLSLAFAPFALSPLAILLPAILLWVWEEQSPRRAAWRGGLFGVGLYTGGMSWVYTTLTQYGHTPSLFALSATGVLMVFLGAYPACTGYLVRRWPWQTCPGRWLLVVPALWTGGEWLRSSLLPGIPWFVLGYSQIDMPLGGLAPVLGVFGVSWAVMVSAGLVLLVLEGQQRWRWGVVGLALWAGVWGLGQVAWTQPLAASVRVSLIQGNIAPQDKARAAAVPQILAHYLQLSRQVALDSDVIIWPETTVAMLYDDLRIYGPAQHVLAAIESLAHQTSSAILIGLPSGTRSTGMLHNSVVGFGTTQGLYHKHRLLPFGEYLPLRVLVPVWKRFVGFPGQEYTPGPGDQPLLQIGRHPIGISICFEATQGEAIRRLLPQSHFLVNVSDDAWFGDSLAPHQHLQIVRMRARETGRYLARTANTGISAIIDQQGRVRASGPQFVAQSVQGNVQPFTGSTPYARLGDVGILVVAGMALLGSYFGSRSAGPRRRRLPSDMPVLSLPPLSRVSTFSEPVTIDTQSFLL